MVLYECVRQRIRTVMGSVKIYVSGKNGIWIDEDGLLGYMHQSILLYFKKNQGKIGLLNWIMRGKKCEISKI